MKIKIRGIFSLLLLLLIPSFSWSQAALSSDPASVRIQGPNTSGQGGFPLATVPATGALPWPVSGTVTANQGTSPWVIGGDSGTAISSVTLNGASQSSTITLNGARYLACYVTGTISAGTVAFEGSPNGTNFTGTDVFGTILYGIPMRSQAAFGDFTFLSSTNFVSGDTLILDVTGLQKVKFASSSTFSGSITFTGYTYQTSQGVWINGEVTPTIGSGDLADSQTNSIFFPTIQPGLNTPLHYIVREENFDGTNWNRQRGANGAAGTTGTGLLGAGLLGYDGTNWQKIVTNSGNTSNGTMRVVMATDQPTNTNPLLVVNRPNGIRVSQGLYRSSITAADKLVPPSTPTVADVATGGSLLAGTTYKASYCADNRFGATTAPAAASVTTASDASNTHVVRITTAQTTGADNYEIFLSTDASPLWVARISEAQRAAGCTITALGTVSATSPGANLVDVRVVGTGAGTNSNNFLQNHAFIPASVTPINCNGFQILTVRWKLVVDDFRNPVNTTSEILSVWAQNTESSSDWHQIGTSGLLQTMPGSTPTGPLEQSFNLAVNGATAVVVLVSQLSSGYNPAITIWCDLD